MTEKEKKLLNRYIMHDTIHKLYHEQNKSMRWIANNLGINFRTVQKYLDMDSGEFQKYSESISNRKCALDPYKNFIVDRLKLFQDTPAAQMHDWLKEHYPSLPEVSAKTVYNYVMKIRQEYNLPKLKPANEREYGPLPDTSPGKYAQVDFGEYKLRKGDGSRIKVYFFAMILEYSRYKFIWFQDKPFTGENAVYAHELAFRFFHGIPGFIVYDQDSVFLYDENIGDYRMTDVFDSYVKSRPFKPVFCRRADPESKGKIENVIKYVKQNFLLNRSYSNIDNLNKDAESWLNRTGNAMVHNTTCKVPYKVWCSECKDLRPYMPVTSSAIEQGYKVLSTNKLRYKGSLYSLPFGTYRGEETRVLVNEKDGSLIITTMNGEHLAKHLIAAGRGENIVNTNHRRDKSASIQKLSDQVQGRFTDKSGSEVFIARLRERYPRYIRDQLTVMLNCLAKYTRQDCDKALDLCLSKGLFSATDFKSILSQATPIIEINEEAEIKPLGTPQTRLMVNIKPNRSDIDVYQNLFKNN
jgi:transposase